MDSPAPVNQPKYLVRDLNRMYFPRELRNAIDGTHNARALNLSNIGGDCSHTAMFGRRVHLDFQVEEDGRLSGKFHVYAEVNLEAARALAATLGELIQRAERL